MGATNSKYVLTSGDTLGVSATESTSLTPSPTYTDLSNVAKQVNWQGGQATEIDVTTFASVGKETAQGLPDYGSWTISGNWVESHAGCTVLRTAQADAKLRAFKLAHLDGSAVEVLGTVTQISVDNALNAAAGGSITVRLSGAPKFTAPTGS